MILTCGPALFSAGVAPVVPSATTWDSAKKGPNITLSNGNLTAALFSEHTGIGSTYDRNSQLVLANNAIPSTGKFYWEIEIVSTVTDAVEYGAMAGISTTVVDYSSKYVAYRCRTGELAKGYGAGGYGFAVRNTGATPPSSTEIQPNTQGGAVAVGDRQGVLFDADSRLLRFTFKGLIDSLQNVTVVAATYYPAVSPGSTSDNVLTVTGHFSDDDWLYTPPAGYVQLP